MLFTNNNYHHVPNFAKTQLDLTPVLTPFQHISPSDGLPWYFTAGHRSKISDAVNELTHTKVFQKIADKREIDLKNATFDLKIYDNRVSLLQEKNGEEISFGSATFASDEGLTEEDFGKYQQSCKRVMNLARGHDFSLSAPLPFTFAPPSQGPQLLPIWGLNNQLLGYSCPNPPAQTSFGSSGAGSSTTSSLINPTTPFDANRVNHLLSADAQAGTPSKANPPMLSSVEAAKRLQNHENLKNNYEELLALVIEHAQIVTDLLESLGRDNSQLQNRLIQTEERLAQLDTQLSRLKPPLEALPAYGNAASELLLEPSSFIISSSGIPNFISSRTSENQQTALLESADTLDDLTNAFENFLKTTHSLEMLIKSDATVKTNNSDARESQSPHNKEIENQLEPLSSSISIPSDTPNSLPSKRSQNQQAPERHKKQLADLQKRLASHQNRINSLQNDKSALLLENIGLKKQLAEASNLSALSDDIVDPLELYKEQHEEDLKKLAANIENLINKNNSLDNKNNELSNIQKSLIGQIENLEEDASNNNAQIDELNKNLTAQETHHKDEKAGHKETKEKLEQALREKDFFRDDNAKIEQKLEELKEEIRALQGNLEKTISENKSLKNENAQNAESISKKNDLINKQNHNISKLEKLAALNKEDLESARVGIERTSNNKDNVEKKNAELKREIKNLSNEKILTDNDNIELRMQIAELNEKLRLTIEGLARALAELGAQKSTSNVSEKFIFASRQDTRKARGVSKTAHQTEISKKEKAAKEAAILLMRSDVDILKDVTRLKITLPKKIANTHNLPEEIILSESTQGRSSMYHSLKKEYKIPENKMEFVNENFLWLLIDLFGQYKRQSRQKKSKNSYSLQRELPLKMAQLSKKPLEGITGQLAIELRILELINEGQIPDFADEEWEAAMRAALRSGNSDSLTNDYKKILTWQDEIRKCQTIRNKLTNLADSQETQRLVTLARNEVKSQ